MRLYEEFMNNLYPLTFTPVLKEYIWGGRNFETRLGRIIPSDMDVVAECWEIAGHKDGTSTINNGTYAGQLLTAVHAELGLDLIGTRSTWAQERDKFPLLIKLLDANRELSVQVHPQDDYALAHEGNELGKTEMWVIVHAEPDAKIILGVKDGTTKAAFRQAIADGNLEQYLHFLPVKTGDHVCVPAGSMHAILDGIMIAEIQQNSNTTYRVYDWNRVGKDGQPRPLHVDKAMDVINFDQVEPSICAADVISDEAGVRRELLCSNRYFTVERVTMTAGATFTGVCDGSTFEIWGTLIGDVTVSGNGNDVPLPSIQFSLLPAAMGAFSVTAVQTSTLLRAYVAE